MWKLIHALEFFQCGVWITFENLTTPNDGTKFCRWRHEAALLQDLTYETNGRWLVVDRAHRRAFGFTQYSTGFTSTSGYVGRNIGWWFRKMISCTRLVVREGRKGRKSNLIFMHTLGIHVIFLIHRWSSRSGYGGKASHDEAREWVVLCLKWVYPSCILRGAAYWDVVTFVSENRFFSILTSGGIPCMLTWMDESETRCCFISVMSNYTRTMPRG